MNLLTRNARVNFNLVFDWHNQDKRYTVKRLKGHTVLTLNIFNMSKTLLDKLSIQGIRSFDTSHGETIQFYSPLTLIAGLNGSGKTTIIESLKYLTTGEMPPNSKGGAFIHDPNLCGEKEVLAVAKMSFLNTQGKKMVCSRRHQLTVKKNTRSQKALEAGLVLHANGERTAISSRVAELNQMMPMYMGVSISVLDNVIFCHQDESLWPMSEPSNLKKKFDEIFEALKYTKAIDNIKVLRKNYKIELDKLKITEGHAKEEKIKGEKVEKRMNQLYADIETVEGQIEELKAQTGEAQRKHEHAADTAGSFGDIVSTLNGKRIEANTKEQNVKELRQHMHVMHDSDEELESMYDKYQERVDSFKEELEREKQKYRDLSAQIKDRQEQVGDMQSKLGKLQAEKEHFDGQLQHRQALVKEAARQHGVRGYDQDLDDDQIDNFMDRMAKMAKDQRSSIEQVQTETRDSTQRVQEELNSHNVRKAAINQNKLNSRSILSQNDRRVSEIRRKINAMHVDEGREAVLQSSVQETQARLDESKKKLDNGDWDKQIPETNARIQSGEQTVKRLREDLRQATKQADEVAKLKLLKEKLAETTTSLKANQGANSEQLTKQLGPAWELPSLNKRYEQVLKDKNSQLKASETQRDSTSLELQQVGYELKKARSLLQNRKKELEEKSKRLREVTNDPLGFDKVITELEEELEDLSMQQSQFSAKKDYFLGVQKVLEEKNKCHLCARAFKNESEKSSIKAKLQNNLEQAEKALNEENINSVQLELGSMKAARPAYDRWKLLQEKEVPEAQKEVERLEPRNAELVEKVEQQDMEVRDRKSAKDGVESLGETIHKISQRAEEISQLEKEIDALSQKQSQAGFTGNFEEINAQLDREDQEVSMAREALNSLKSKRDSMRGDVSTLEIELRDAKSHLATVTQQLKDKSNYQEQLEDISNQSEEQRANITELDSELSTLAPKISQTQIKLDDVARRGAEKESELQENLSNLNNTLNALELAARDIKAYLTNDGPRQLSRCSDELDHQRNALSNLEADQRNLVTHINNLEKQGNKHDETKRHIQENLRYRDNIRALDVVKAEIADLQSHNAEADRHKWQEEVKKWQSKRNRLASEESELWGRKKTMDTELVRLQEEFQTEYDGAPYRYRESHVKVEATKAAVEDLGRYGGALDKAIMRYHSLKMDEINEIIDDLWRRTYQGTDVDTILIRSDSEGPMRAGNKSYNYRVCMIKQDAEMDMRGRCSAGQKVLASIIIRLALAECFGTNCGVIALDEPTTNLDRDNIRALAQSLHSIIRARASTQRNFQLIVITHDEEFIRDMRAMDFADYYYRISRDMRQKSMITKQSLHEVFK